MKIVYVIDNGTLPTITLEGLGRKRIVSELAKAIAEVEGDVIYLTGNLSVTIFEIINSARLVLDIEVQETFCDRLDVFTNAIITDLADSSTYSAVRLVRSAAGYASTMLEKMEKTIDRVEDLNGQDLARLEEIVLRMKEVRNESIYNRYLNNTKLADIAKEYGYTSARISQIISEIRKQSDSKRFRMQF